MTNRSAQPHKEAHRGDMRGERREGVGRRRHEQRAEEQLDIGGEAHAGRTLNMPPMSMTLDVSQLEISSLNPPKELNNPFMLVIDETSQLEMGPYVLKAFALSVTHIWTAVFREA